MVDQARRAALAEASADQARLDSLQGRLSGLVAAQQAQQQAQQAQARAAAAAAAGRSTTQGLPVNGGLVAVVRAVVAPAPAPAAPVSAAPPTTAPSSVPPTTLPPASPASPSAGSGGDGGAGGVWLQLRQCESGDDYQADTGNGYFGAYQFSQQTWTDLGFPGRPDLEPPAMQDSAAQKLQAQSGWGQWPACSAALGLS
ncbi:MAG TPA: transglycosylase family protein, partial [Acidimicrobiales bacterium]|nr:transglycosylase family protein [Acidimicrobiales bacterium]